jgi:hypothetical protein
VGGLIIDLYEHIDDPTYLAKEEIFESWYENPIGLPGRWYLQVISQIFKENRVAKGEFIGLGRKLDLHNIAPEGRIVQETVPGGHIGLFMGANTLRDHWPRIARWICAQWAVLSSGATRTLRLLSLRLFIDVTIICGGFGCGTHQVKI